MLELGIYNDPRSNSLKVYLLDHCRIVNGTKKSFMAKTVQLEWEEIERHQDYIPFLEISKFEMQTDMNEIISMLVNTIQSLGYRDRLGELRDGEISAIKKHLEDMRKIVFSESKYKQLEKKKE
jgi:hypothetical protein